MSTERNKQTVDLGAYSVTNYAIGAGIVRRTLWYFVNAVVLMNPLVPFYGPKRWVLRVFGAKIGRGVVLKPGVSVKYPWRLKIGENSWVGERVWIDNLADVEIGQNVCISQEAYLLTGNHNYKSRNFDLIVNPIVISDGAWIGARAVVCPGVEIGRNAVAAVGAVLTKTAESDFVYAGNPAEKIRERKLDP